MHKFDFAMDFGERLKRQLNKKSMTQEMLAEYIDVGQSTISMYVLGERLPSIDKLINICHELDCTIEDLIDTTERITW